VAAVQAVVFEWARATGAIATHQTVHP